MAQRPFTHPDKMAQITIKPPPPPPAPPIVKPPPVIKDPFGETVFTPPEDVPLEIFPLDTAHPEEVVIPSKVVIPLIAPPSLVLKETKPMSHWVRARNLDYPLNGSITSGEGRVNRWSLPPNRWTEVESDVYNMLRSKFSDPQTHEVPAALPDRSGNYNVRPEHTRSEQHLQYLLEFQTR